MSEINQTILKVENVSNTYVAGTLGIFGKKNFHEVLRNVNMEVRAGEIFGLVGESGCGKTTLIRAILGLLEYHGKITIDGIKQTGKNRREMSTRVQAVFQDPAGALNPVKSIGWLLEEPLRVHGVKNKQERKKRTDEMLELIGLGSSYRNRHVGELSGGQKQRICIGCALMLNPKLLIADEAVSALDVSVGAQIINLLKDLHSRLGLSIVFISHNLRLVYYLCDRIAVMYNGELVEQGTADDVYYRPKHEYTNILLNAASDNI